MKKFFLDTNSYSSLFEGDKIIQKEIANADIVYISVITLGELYRGFKGGTRETDNAKLLEDFLSKPNIEISPLNKKIAKVYGDVSYLLRKQGTPLPTNDVWIAAQTIETDSTLITYDEHFLKIKGLKLWSRILK